MSFVIRIRTWRARRNERKAEKLIALGENDVAGAEADRLQDDIDKSFLAADAHIPQSSEWARHIGEEGKSHY